MESAAPGLLVVDDEADLRELIGEYFSRQGLRVEAVADAAAARETFRARPPAIAILDVHMPGEDGLSLARWMREHHPATGVVMLTTAAETMDRIVGLELGADDYVPKPFDLRELHCAHQGAAAPAGDVAGPCQPCARHRAGRDRVRFGERWLDLGERRLFDQVGAEIPITAAEFELLALFARHPNRPLNRDQIMEQAHNRGWDVFDRSIDLRVMRLRRKIERNPDKPEVLKTVRNVGYVFVPVDH